MGEKDVNGLGLSLSLGCSSAQEAKDHEKSHHHHHLLKFQPSVKLNLMPFSSQLFTQNDNYLHKNKNSWTDIFQPSGGNSDLGSFHRGLDMNRAPLAVDCDDEAGVSSPNSTISCTSGKRSEREPVGDETEAERASCSRGSDDEDGGAGDDASRKKLRLSKEQSLVLEETFKEHNTLNPKQKLALAKQLNLRPRQVEVWFQNRRARTKLKQTEVDCEYLKRCCETLTEENRRLQKEVQELRALKLSPQLYMHMSPPTTLTMCPSCERVAVSSSSSSSAAAAVSSAVASTAPSRQPIAPKVRRPLPMSPWAALPIHHQAFGAPASRS